FLQEQVTGDAEQPQPRPLTGRDRVQLLPGDQVGLREHICGVLGALGAAHNVGKEIGAGVVSRKSCSKAARASRDTSFTSAKSPGTARTSVPARSVRASPTRCGAPSAAPSSPGR